MFSVPFLYRDALRMVQGAEGAAADLVDDEAVDDVALT